MKATAICNECPMSKFITVHAIAEFESLANVQYVMYY